MIELSGVIYQGPQISDLDLLNKLPQSYREILNQINGLIAFDGGIHIRGICANPNWHSISEIMFGNMALHKLYESILDTDIPFGQDVVGDQFILRENKVYRLYSEIDDLLDLDCTLNEFLEMIQSDPIDNLGLYPLIEFMNNGNSLQPGQLLNIYPPFCTKEAANGVSIRAISVFERIKFLADFASQIKSIKENEQVRIKISE
jgi:hypothetical protein